MAVRAKYVRTTNICILYNTDSYGICNAYRYIINKYYIYMCDRYVYIYITNILDIHKYGDMNTHTHIYIYNITNIT